MIDEDLISKVEKTLGVSLYGWQIAYILGKSQNISEYGYARKHGRNLAFCLRLALEEGEPIDVEDLSACFGKNNQWLKRSFLNIRQELKDAGIPVREIIF